MSVDQPPSAARGPVPLRHHEPLALRTVFVAPQRAMRPVQTGRAGAAADCPFCAGHESRTPPAVLRKPEDAALPWHVRLVPNEFPVVMEAAPGGPAPDGSGLRQPAHGVHEVLVECPDHERSILAIPPARWRDAWELCRRRLAALSERSDLAWAFVFKNSGPAAGASLEHVHSQLVALDFLPPFVAGKIAIAGCASDPFGSLIRLAEAEGRIVAEQGDLVALVPHAPRQPFETLILPRSACRHFHAADADAVAAVASLTQRVVARLDRIVPGADYNWWLHQAPFASVGSTSAGIENWHWHLEILPRLAEFAGFELATGCHITTMSPAESARRLREA
ncbi:MAG: DUF4921 family protein [Planctomycetia bacterium]|nr:DUF4921 family protein [Planctomycetia bacterium]